MKQHIRSLAILVFSLCAATLLAFLFFHFGNKNLVNIALVYILALIIIATNTKGYGYGIAASFFCVGAVNIFFTYPYFKMDFSMDGYPFIFLAMLAISISTSAIIIRARKQTAALEERERKLVEADKERLRANLLRAISHDLRTPLTSIIGSSASYLENAGELTDSERLELVSNINEDANWLLNMVENLLTVTRIQDDTGLVRKSPEVVEEVVAEAITRIKKRIPDITVQVDMPNNFLLVPMDATLIEQVLINLLENARVHSQCSSPIDLNIRETSDAIAFHIRDYGVGLDEKQIPQLFDGKYTSDSADSHRGIGIGLSICKTIINAHSGTITARAHADGAEFIFTLPTEREVTYDA